MRIVPVNGSHSRVF